MIWIPCLCLKYTQPIKVIFVTNYLLKQLLLISHKIVFKYGL